MNFNTQMIILIPYTRTSKAISKSNTLWLRCICNRLSVDGQITIRKIVSTELHTINIQSKTTTCGNSCDDLSICSSSIDVEVHTIVSSITRRSRHGTNSAC